MHLPWYAHACYEQHPFFSLENNGTRLCHAVRVLREHLPWALVLMCKRFHYSTMYPTQYLIVCYCSYKLCLTTIWFPSILVLSTTYSITHSTCSISMPIASRTDVGYRCELCSFIIHWLHYHSHSLCDYLIPTLRNVDHMSTLQSQLQSQLHIKRLRCKWTLLQFLLSY